ncbi:MAG: Ku protein [Candidatus Dormibacteraeota bacterium]|nr:Ku protein [Candidatus Dormibacteraeota bacterium]
MPRSMWKGVISFGMVSIPVRLYVATDSHAASFNQLCAEHMSRIKYKRWCEAGEHEVQYSDIVKGYEVSSDNYVVIQDSDLENLPLPTSHTIEINEFVPEHDIQGGLYFKSAYYMEPEEVGKKPYQLLRQALAETQMTAVAKVAFRDREHLCSLQPQDGFILMNTLHWPDEIRSTDGLKGLEDGKVQISPRELQMAKSLVQSLSEETFDPSRYQDDYHRALMSVVEAKIQGQEVVEAPEEEAGPKVMDLMDALKASVDAAKQQRATRETPARKPAQRRRAS